MNKFKSPESEESMISYGDGNGNIIGHATRKITEPTKHYLYMIVDGAWKKVRTSENPNDFDKILYSTAKS